MPKEKEIFLTAKGCRLSTAEWDKQTGRRKGTAAKKVGLLKGGQGSDPAGGRREATRELWRAKTSDRTRKEGGQDPHPTRKKEKAPQQQNERRRVADLHLRLLQHEEKREGERHSRRLEAKSSMFEAIESRWS